MRAWVMSDIHTEFHADPGKFWENVEKLRRKYEDPEVLILAGDIGGLGPRESKRTYEFFTKATNTFKQIVYVPGNHEFFGTSISEGHASIEDWGFANLALLRPGRVFKYNSIRFLGGTMWYPEPEPFSMGDAQKDYFVDYRLIHDFEKEVYKEHNAFVESMKKCQKEDVVVTHHLPSSRSTPPQFKDSPINCFFVHDIEEAIRSAKPRLFVHGHTHSPMDYTIGETRIYCNPLGYPREGVNPSFWSRVPIYL